MPSNASVRDRYVPSNSNSSWINVSSSRSYIYLLRFILSLGPLPSHAECCLYSVARFSHGLSSSCKYFYRHSISDRFATYSIAKSTSISAKHTHSIYPYDRQYLLSGKILQLKLYMGTLVIHVDLPKLTNTSLNITDNISRAWLRGKYNYMVDGKCRYDPRDPTCGPEDLESTNRIPISYLPAL